MGPLYGFWMHNSGVWEKGTLVGDPAWAPIGVAAKEKVSGKILGGILVIEPDCWRFV